MSKNNNYWTYDKCKNESIKYNNWLELKENNLYVYVKSYKNNWIKDFYIDFKNELKWTKRNCLKEAEKYKTYKDFRLKSKSAYTICLRKSWIQDIKKIFNKSENLDKNTCLKEAKKYQTKTEFKKNSYKIYKIAYINCWLDEICSHMKKTGNLYRRCIYAFEFPNNYVYIGLTYNIDIREKQHYMAANSKVNIFYKKSGLIPNLKKLTDYLDIKEAKAKEAYYINFYRENNWNVLNIQEGGNLGGNYIKNTRKMCKKEALKYSLLIEFRKNKPNIYKTIIRQRWNDLISHMKKTSPAKVKWTKDICKKEALKYKSKMEFYINNVNAYNACVRNKWISELCTHMN